MKFDFDDTQYALRDLAREIFAKESPPSRVRDILDGKPVGRSVWKTMAEAGICGITVPETYGGAGGTELDLTLVYEEAGRAALPEPLLEFVGIAAPVLVEYGTDSQKQRWLPAIANGDADVEVHIDGEDVCIGDDVIVGSFQALTHTLASMHVAIEGTRPAAWYAAYAIATHAPDASIAAAVAKIAANDTEEFCNGEALQCHGGIGFTWEHDLHLWLKRGMELRATYGRSHELRRNFAAVHTLEELL
jgi:alkylation response protein AidB-like acyl-CoA dehydrogenase